MCNATARVTGAALGRFRLISVDTSTPGKLIHCPAGGGCVGSLQEGAPNDIFAAGTVVSPDEIEIGKEVTLVAGEILAPGDFFKAGAYGGADGYAVKDASKTVDTLGKVRQAAAAGERFRAEYTK